MHTDIDVPTHHLARLLLHRQSDLLICWLRLVDRTPWAHVPDHERLDGLPGVLAAVGEALQRGPLTSAESRLRIAEPAAEHGRTRAIQHVSFDVIPTEYSLLRLAIWSTFKAELSPNEQLVFFNQIDYALSVATRAAMLGYYADQLSRDGSTLAEALARLASSA